MSNKAWIQYTKEGRIIPGSLIISKTRPVNGVWYEVVEKIYNSPTPPFGVISSKTKAFVKYDGSGQIVPGSLIITNSSLPKPGIWKEVYVNIPPSMITTTTTTFCPNCVAHDVTIGTQTWAACNLDVDHYLNGDPIPEITDPTVWSSLTTGAWCYYNNDGVNGPIYGKLYNWYAVNDPRGLASAGYHVPSDSEWLTLTNGLAGLYSGGYLKETTLCHWLSPNNGATNVTGFTALGGGFRGDDGVFDTLKHYGLWWTVTEYDSFSAWRRAMYSGQLDVQQAYNAKGFGFSVRLIKD